MVKIKAQRHRGTKVDFSKSLEPANYKVVIGILFVEKNVIHIKKEYKPYLLLS